MVILLCFLVVVFYGTICLSFIIVVVSVDCRGVSLAKLNDLSDMRSVISAKKRTVGLYPYLAQGKHADLNCSLLLPALREFSKGEALVEFANVRDSFESDVFLS